MSLFASSFDSPSASAGPSSLSVPTLGKQHKDGNKKRKRASLGSGSAFGGGGTDRLKSTEANFHKIMQRVDGGGVREKGGDSGNMGGKAGTKSAKDKGKPKGEVIMRGKGARERAAMNAAKAAEEPSDDKTQHSEAIPPKKKAKAQAKPAERPAMLANGKHAPAELPLPHDTPKSKRKSSAGDASMTDLQKGMQAKLEGARFRWINEQLYSNPSTEAVVMMKKDPKIFEDYHQTHRALTSAWPSPPLPHLLTLLTPLPAKTLIVDLGCGDAGLAQALVPQGKIVLSYDLVGDSGSPSGIDAGGSGSGGWVVEADFLEHVPLPGRPGGSTTASGDVEEGGSEELSRRGKKGKAKARAKEASEVVDVVVCCLSLMGVNWVGGIYEACRILKQGGTLHIAEVTSRFISSAFFMTKVESFGFKLNSTSEPSTHFTLFEFTKEAEVPLGPVRGQAGWEGRVKEGEEILRGCVYKKR